MVVQKLIKQGYLDLPALDRLLEYKFGFRRYKITVETDDIVYIEVPERLTQDEKDSVKKKDNGRLRKIRRRNAHNTVFVPPRSIELSFDEKAIDQLLPLCAIPEGSYPHVRDAVIREGIRTLCILFQVDLEKSITVFVRNCHNGLLDHKLPLNQHALKDILSNSAEVDSFYDAQWEFIAPELDGRHQVYEDRVILPFMSSQKIDTKHRGLNSEIWRITILEDHVKSNKKSVIPVKGTNHGVVHAIRKELPNDRGSDKEKEIHGRLNQLNHPNILGLYGSYTQNGLLNLVLPAMGNRISDLWEDEDDSLAQEYFPEEKAYFDAMAGLASAISSLHNFKGEAVGCHHDLKPNNILLQNSSFILADYGLTTFKQPLENSKTASSRFDAYLAPECLNTTDLYEQNEVGRASDIYSLACILVELLVFMVEGRVGIVEFCKDRAQALNQGISGHPFYDLSSRGLSKAVSDRLENIRHLSSRKTLLVDLLLDMLEWDPERRPDAEKVHTTIMQICKATSGETSGCVVLEADSIDISQASSLNTTRDQSRPKPSVPSKAEHLALLKFKKQAIHHLDQLLRVDLRLEEQGRVKSLWTWEQSSSSITEWAARSRSSILFIISMDEGRFRRPISYVSARIIDHALNYDGPKRLVCIGYFCQPGIPYPDEDIPNMFRNLLGQLHELISDPIPVEIENQPNLKSTPELFKAFEQTIKLLPADSTVVCVIDSLDYYQRRDHYNETNRWINRLIAIGGQSATRFKLLLTLPSLHGGRPSLERYDISNNDVLDFHGGDDDDRYGLDQSFWRAHPLHWA